MDSRIEKLAQVIIRYSTAVQPGERVLIRGTSPLAEPLAQTLYQEALRAGAYAFTYLHLSLEDALAMEATDNTELLAEANPMLQLMYETSDVIVRIDASENDRALAGYPQELQFARNQARYAPLKVQMEREGNKTLRRCSTLFPTQALAQTAGMSLLRYEDFVYSACLVNLPDPVAGWTAIKQSQQRLVDYLAGKKHLHVRGQNIDLQMSIEGRTFLNACGTANMPDGEIFTGPVEDSVQGWVKFTYPAYYAGNEVVGIELKFEDGLITQATAQKNESFLLSMLDTDDSSRRLGEFAIGTNNEIQRFTGSILFDEKIGGTVHMAVGQGYAETGSVNKSNIHWDMICDMREGGEILVDGKLFYQNGRFLV